MKATLLSGLAFTLVNVVKIDRVPYMGKKKPPNPDDPDSPFPKEKEAIPCGLCGKNDFRKCGCPWGKPFQTWPPGHLSQAKALEWPSDID